MTERLAPSGSTHRRATSSRVAPGTATVDILGLPVVRAGRDDVLGAVARHIESADRFRIAYVNAHTATLAARSDSFHRCLRSYDLLLNDGIGVALAARLAGASIAENLNGSDFTEPLLELFAAHDLSVFLFGAAPGVVESAAAHLTSRIPGLKVAGMAHGYQADSSAVVGLIAQSGADVVIVALGNPLQEQWIVEHLDDTGARGAVAVGAFLDFTAGTVRRAPGWINRIGGEWFFRLAHEPRRLARRYLIGIPEFLWLVARSRSSR